MNTACKLHGFGTLASEMRKLSSINNTYLTSSKDQANRCVVRKLNRRCGYLRPLLQTTVERSVLVQKVQDALVEKLRVVAVHEMCTVGYN